MSASRTGRRQRSAPPSPARPRSPWLLALLIAIAGVGTYWNSLNGPFIWDDEIAIVTNRTIQHLWPPGDPLNPPRETPVAGRPLVNLSFAFNYALGGLHETGYHLVNIAIHVACALLLFGIVRRTLQGKQQSADTTALVVALLWMIHPLQSEAVDYITQRSESLMALFLLLTLYGSIRARQSGRPEGRPLLKGRALPHLPEGPPLPKERTLPQHALPKEGAGPPRGSSWHRAAWYAVAIVACACGMASKESMMVAPIVVVLYDWAFEFESFGAAIRARALFYGGLATTWVIAAALLLTLPRSTAGLSTTVGSWMYLLNQVEMIGRYLRLSVWPSDLVLDYGLPRSLSLRDVAPSALVIVALLLATLVALLRSRAIGFLAASFFLTLAPTSSVIPISSEVGAERRMYLPFAALAALVVAGGRFILDRRPTAHAITGETGGPHRVRPTSEGQAGGSKRMHSTSESRASSTYGGRALSRPARVATVSMTALVLLALAVRTIARNAEYASTLALWRTVVDRRPHGRARMALATELATAGQHAQAIPLLRDAVTDFPDARAALGTELILQRQYGEGIAVLRQFVADGPSRPNRIPAHVMIAEALVSQGKLDDAAGEWRAILALAPGDSGARAGLARLISAQAQQALQRGDADSGERYAREALQLAPGDGAAHNFLGVALASKGNLTEALSHFREAQRIAPDDPQFKANLDRAVGAMRNAK
jgi:Flp pilus assembly protein TadD